MHKRQGTSQLQVECNISLAHPLAVWSWWTQSRQKPPHGLEQSLPAKVKWQEVPGSCVACRLRGRFADRRRSCCVSTTSMRLSLRTSIALHSSLWRHRHCGYDKQRNSTDHSCKLWVWVWEGKGVSRAHLAKSGCRSRASAPASSKGCPEMRPWRRAALAEHSLLAAAGTSAVAAARGCHTGRVKAALCCQARAGKAWTALLQSRET